MTTHDTRRGRPSTSGTSIARVAPFAPGALLLLWALVRAAG